MTRMVEKRASTVEEATSAALAELGVARDAVKVEVLSEGKRGLFSGRSRAHVRVTVLEATADHGEAPVTETAVEDAGVIAEDASTDEIVGVDEPIQKGSGDEAVAMAPGAEADATGQDATDRLGELNEEADLAADFVEGLLDILELPGDIEIDVDETQAFVNVVDVGSGLLIGRRGATLDALQELVRAATQRQIERRSHVRIDIEGYRQRQLEKMKDRCRDGIAQVRETGEPFRLEPMDAFERKIMHDLVSRTGGVTSASVGTEPRRRVFVYTDEE
jgi:spoIIIJ-associated protein